MDRVDYGRWAFRVGLEERTAAAADDAGREPATKDLKEAVPEAEHPIAVVVAVEAVRPSRLGDVVVDDSAEEGPEADTADRLAVADSTAAVVFQGILDDNTAAAAVAYCSQTQRPSSARRISFQCCRRDPSSAMSLQVIDQSEHLRPVRLKNSSRGDPPPKMDSFTEK